MPILGAATRARELAPELYRRLFELGEPYVVFDDVLGNDVRGAMLEDALAPVSYTHLTLPTICSV